MVAPWLALDPLAVVLARTLADDLLLNLFLPVTERTPDWLRPASSGLVGVTTACTDRVRPLPWRHGGHLVLSSGNRTGEDVAVSAAQADAAFEGRLLVLDGDDERDPDVPCGSAAIVVVRRDGDLDLARGGIQTAGRDPRAVLDGLRRAAAGPRPSPVEPSIRGEPRMDLTADDRLEIHEVIALHGHLTDAGAYDRFGEVFTPDLEIDAGDVGRAPLRTGDPERPRLEAYIAAAHRIGPGSTLSLHVTNIVVRADGDGARAWSKSIAVHEDGSAAGYAYDDQLVRTSRGWRIRHRTVSARREPGRGGEPPMPR
ncbi:MAG: hypothetical protein QOE59_5085 [Actinomycetota bacterium]|nr:hypothetical protein [Actinomycetota bacterium]